MDNIAKMSKQIGKITFFLSIPASVLVGYFFKLHAFLGVWIGTGIGLLGFGWIVHFCRSISESTDGKKEGTIQYIGRYLLYGCLLFGFACFKIPVLSMLLGILCHKAAILLYSVRTRKEMEDVSSE